MTINVQPGKANPDLSERVAEEIRALMARRRVSGRELARRLDTSSAWVSYRLTGAQPIDLNDLQRIAESLGVEVTSLIPTRSSEARPWYPSNDVRRPSDRRPPSRPVSSRAPSGPGRTTRVRPPIAA